MKLFIGIVIGIIVGVAGIYILILREMLVDNETEMY